MASIAEAKGRGTIARFAAERMEATGMQQQPGRRQATMRLCRPGRRRSATMLERSRANVGIGPAGMDGAFGLDAKYMRRRGLILSRPEPRWVPGRKWTMITRIAVTHAPGCGSEGHVVALRTQRRDASSLRLSTGCESARIVGIAAPLRRRISGSTPLWLGRPQRRGGIGYCGAGVIHPKGTA